MKCKHLDWIKNNGFEMSVTLSWPHYVDIWFSKPEVSNVELLVPECFHSFSSIIRKFWYQTFTRMRSPYALYVSVKVLSLRPVQCIRGVWWLSPDVKCATHALSLKLELGSWFSRKMSSYPNRKSHCGEKTVIRSPSIYIFTGIFFRRCVSGRRVSPFC